MTDVRRPAAILTLALLAGCPPGEAYDRDRDGYDADQLGGADCDDGDAAVNPGVDEVCGDGVDNNCDAAVDDDGVGAQTWFLDEDGDGYGTSTTTTACEQPPGYADNDDDCDDTRDDVHPGADEIFYDDTDDNCDPSDDHDADGDGEASIDHGGPDCDDTRDDVNSTATEVCNNGVDDDCNGIAPTCAWADGPYADHDHTRIELPGIEDAIVTSLVDTGDPALFFQVDNAFYGFQSPLPLTPRSAVDADATLVMPDLSGDRRYSMNDTNEVGLHHQVVLTWYDDVQLRLTALTFDFVAGPADQTEDHGQGPNFKSSTIPMPPPVSHQGTPAHRTWTTLHSWTPLGPGNCAVHMGWLTPVLWPGYGTIRVVPGCQEAYEGLLEEPNAASVLLQTDAGIGVLRVDELGSSEIQAVAASDLPIIDLWPDEDGTLLEVGGDFDGDGYTDLHTLPPPTSHEVYELRFGPAADYSQGSRILTINGDPETVGPLWQLLDVTYGDYNGDDQDDLALLWSPTPSAATPLARVTLFYGPIGPGVRGGTTDNDAVITLPPSTHTVLTTNMNGDGNDDLVSVDDIGAIVLYGSGQ